MSEVTITNAPASQVTSQVQQVAQLLPDGGIVGSSSGKLGFYGLSTPIVQPTAITAVTTTAATSSTPYGWSSTQADSIVTAVNLIIAKLKALGLTA